MKFGCSSTYDEAVVVNLILSFSSKDLFGNSDDPLSILCVQTHHTHTHNTHTHTHTHAHTHAPFFFAHKTHTHAHTLSFSFSLSLCVSLSLLSLSLSLSLFYSTQYAHSNTRPRFSFIKNFRSALFS